jgi:ketosteroid isomerase-like protein
MDRAEANTLLARLQDAQNQFYAGGDAGPVAAALAPDITWSVPGHSPIAGTYRGVDSVLGYFARRRDIANSTFRIYRRDVLAGAGDRIAALTDGTATIAGRERSWSTVGLYEIRGRLVAACWLLPLDPAEFDAIWSP